MRVMITGGAGYIGSHIAAALLSRGDEVHIVDDLSTGKALLVKGAANIGGRVPLFTRLDIRNDEELSAHVDAFAPDAVVHCAGLKSVAESVADPLRYYQTNLDSTFSLLRVMIRNNIGNLVFSSSATVYGASESGWFSETSPVGIGITNPYGRTKFMIEEVLKDVAAAAPHLAITSLRYFNPIGAHSSGLIGEIPSGVPNNVLPYICQVATGERPHLSVFGDDYQTADGTGVRDYIHVEDLAEGHLAALDAPRPGFRTFNLGTGEGTSVLELVRSFERATGQHIPIKLAARRPGDVAISIAIPDAAASQLDWHATRSVDEACVTAWAWQRALNRISTVSVSDSSQQPQPVPPLDRRVPNQG